MSASNSLALTKRSASGALMPPPAAPKRIKRPSVVLDEDTYTSAVSHIIRRDFFPGLAETDAQREYLNAVESKDRSWIREAGRKLTQVMTPVPDGRRKMAERTRFNLAGGAAAAAEKTPSVWGADTPLSVAQTDNKAEDEDAAPGKLDSVDLNLSLGAFQAKYTSEDQESFSQIIDEHNRTKFEKNAWLRKGNMYASKQRVAQQKVIEAKAKAASTCTEVVVARPSQNLDDRPAAPNTHRHTAFNSLMFNPDSVEQWAPTRTDRAEAASLAPPKQVLYNNTRLPAPEAEAPQPPSPTLSAVRDAVAGRPRLNPSEGGYSGSATPRVKGYAFVDAQAPDSDEEEEEEAPTDLLERYGIERSHSGNTKATPFSIHDTSAREKMHHRMVEQIGAKRANKNNYNNKMKPPGAGLGIFTSETPRFLSAPTPARLAAGQTPGRKNKNKNDLTPAAQRLLERVGGATPKHVGPGELFGKSKMDNDKDKDKEKEYTPTSKLKRKS